MQLKPGSRWKSAVCTTEIVVVRPSKADVALECGGYAMLTPDSQPPSGFTLEESRASGTLVGKRYFDEQSGLEVLCSKTGQGSLSLGGRLLAQREPKKLPSSD